MAHSYFLLGALLQRDPVLAVGAHVNLVGRDVIGQLGFLGDRSLGSDGRDEPQKT